jgi:hypothetical protein
VSDERRRASDGLHEKVDTMSTDITEIKTMLNINFHPETGHFVKDFKEVKATVKQHDEYVKYGKGAFAVLAGLGGLGFAWLKTQIGSGKH